MKFNALLYATATGILLAVFYALRLWPFGGVPRAVDCPPLVPSEIGLPAGAQVHDLGTKADVVRDGSVGFSQPDASWLARLKERGVRFPRGTYDAVATWRSGRSMRVLLRLGDAYGWVAGGDVSLHSLGQ